MMFTNGLRCQGFSAIELLVVLALLGILSALAGPSMVQSVQRYRMSAMADELSGLIQLARAEAIRTRTTGIVEANSLASCSTGTDTADWSCGAFVFLDVDGDASRGNTEPILRETQGNPAISVKRVGATTANQLSFNGFGVTTNTPGTLVIKPTSTFLGDSTLTLCFTAVGRVMRKTGAAVCS